MSQNDPMIEKLDSWKEIAVYLNRDISTVQRWEKEEGLPVHRHLHHKQATVYAYGSEIDAWLEDRQMGKAAADVPVTATAPARQRSYLQLAVGGATVLLALVALALFWPFTPAPPGAIDSIAVLPFENLSDDPDLEYLSEGIAGDVIYSLSQLPSLRVMPTSSVLRYKGQEVSPQRVASDLRVRAVVMGTATQRGENFSLTVELVDTQEDRLLWGRQYTRKSTDLLTLKEKLAKDISESLRLQLSGHDQDQLNKQYTENSEAYLDYLRGRHHQKTRLPADLAKAVDYFNSAIEKDPRYAQAYAGLAETYFLQGAYYGRSVDEFYQRELSAAQTALVLDDTLSDAHAVLGAIKAMHGWDWGAGEEHLKRALELNPNDFRAHQILGGIFWWQRRWDEALEEYKKAESLNPTLSSIKVNLAWVHMSKQEYEEAIKLLQEAVELEPNRASPRFHLTWAYWYNGMAEEAIAQAEKWAPLPKRLPDLEPKLPVFLRQLAAGDRVEAMRTLENWRGLVPTFRGSYYALLGEKEKAIEWLSEAVEERYHGAPSANTEPAWEPLLDDPRFQDLLRRMNLGS